MELFLIYFGVCIAILVISWMIFGKEITVKEFFLFLGIQTLLIASICAIVYTQGLKDQEILNSRVVEKYKDRVSCSHSYSCPPCWQSCSGTGKTKSCHRQCSTCHEHSYDYNWVVKDAIGSFNISRVNRQGTVEPDRFTAVKIGEPTAHHHSYDNYVKADPDSLFKLTMSEEDMLKYPKYPKEIFDYYRLNRLISLVAVDNKEWNEKISEINAEVGPSKQANLVVVLAKGQTNKYALSLQRAWEGAKKNDVVVVINTDDNATISWVETIGISYPDFKVKMRMAVIDYGKLDIGVLEVIQSTIVNDYKRRPMSEFEYLKNSFKPSKTAFILGLILSIIITIGGVWIAVKEDVV